jgi:hypothetical protein
MEPLATSSKIAFLSRQLMLPHGELPNGGSFVLCKAPKGTIRDRMHAEKLAHVIWSGLKIEARTECMILDGDTAPSAKPSVYGAPVLCRYVQGLIAEGKLEAPFWRLIEIDDPDSR